MKNSIILIFLVVLTLFSACQDEDRRELLSQPEIEQEPDSIQILLGDFLYVGDAAVLRGYDFVYEVAIDSVSKELAEKIKPHKKEDFDMVPVRIKGKISANTNADGWDERIEIREIIEVPATEEFSEDNR